MNALKYFVDVILAIVILFVFVNMNYSQKQDVLINEYLTIKTKEFTDNIRVHGYLTKQMYERFQQELSAIGGYFEIELTHDHFVYEPEYNNQVFTRNIMTYTERCFTDEIIASLYQNGIYVFAKDDFIKVTVTSKSTSFGRATFQNLFGFSYTCIASSSGKIRDIAWY